ncbi:MAG: transglycosylase SLT domain-containing protein [Saprospiraceae bacterium]
MPRLCTSLLLIMGLLCHIGIAGQPEADRINVLTPKGLDGVPTFTEKDLEERIQNLPSTVLFPQYNSAVKGYIHKYVMRSRDHTEEILGRAAMYFPIFEEQLTERGLPLDLRCLPIVESALNPNAVSSAFAVGLWQFMPETAREQGLRIDRSIDERRDPYRSTEGALDFLTKLYERFGDWALALAAYNAGAGRVNRAIKKANSTDFWKIRDYLPHETRNYVPAFIAAMYVWNYAHLHNLQPQLPAEAAHRIARVRVFNKLSFSQISDLTNLTESEISALNPALRRQSVPATKDGVTINLPVFSAQRLIDFLALTDHPTPHLLPAAQPGNYAQPNSQGQSQTKSRTFWHLVTNGETLNAIARNYGCTTDELMEWNQLNTTTIRANEHLIIHASTQPFVPLEPVSRLSGISCPRLVSVPIAPVRFEPIRSPSHPHPRLFIEHYLERGQSLLDIVQIFPHVTLETILEMNNLDGNRVPQPGDLLRLPLAH